MKRISRIKILAAGGLLCTAIGMSSCGIAERLKSSHTENSKERGAEAERLLEQGDLAGASEQYCEILRQYPRNIEARVGLAKVQTERADFEAAVDTLSLTMMLAPDEREVYETFADLCERSGDVMYGRTLLDLAQENNQTWFEHEYVPEAPTADHESGTYSERIRVALSGNSTDEIYYDLETADGKNVEQAKRYHSPILLPRGESTLSVYSVRNGIPSETLKIDYRIDSEPVEILFQDKALETLVKRSLGIVGDQPVTDVDAEMVEELDCRQLADQEQSEEENVFRIQNLSDLVWFPNLQFLSLDGYKGITDWSLLADTKIETLRASDCNLSSLEELKDMDDLKALSVENNLIEDLSPVLKMKSISRLELQNNPTRDLSQLENSKIQVLSLSGNQIGNMEFLTRLKKLRGLTIEGPVEDADFRPLNQLTGLKLLSISGCVIPDGQLDLSGMTELENLTLRNVSLCDVSPFASLEHLKYLDISDNPGITDISSLTALKNLERLYLSGTSVTPEQVEEYRKKMPGCTISQ